MARKTKEDTFKTVTAILDAAEKVFVTHGVAKATISQIAEGACVSKGAVYGHYKDKIDVCVAVCMRQMADLSNVLGMKKDEPPLETLLRWGLDYTRLFFDSTSFRRVGEILYVKCENSPEFDPIQKIRTVWERKMFRATGTMVRKAITSNDLPKNTDPHLVNVYLHSLIDGLISSYYYSNRLPESNPMDMVEKILKMGIQTISYYAEATPRK